MSAVPGARTALLINAAELMREPGTRRAVRVDVPLAEVDAAEERLRGDVAVDVAAESTLDDVVVRGTLTVDWSDRCRRCLRELAAPVVVDVEERYAPVGARHGAPDADAGRLDAEAAFPIEHGQLDLAPMVRENVLLGIPDAPLCRDDCPGLCPTCGADLAGGPCACDRDTRDERWAALDQLRLDE